MGRPPILTAFGSCRVVTPCSILRSQGRAGFNQANIFGFVHNALEIPQQFQLICGGVQAPSRLRGFLNIPAGWKAPEPTEASTLQEEFHRKFADTDVFVVEVSSVRVLQFKAFYLQIHRTREILLAGGATEGWWQKLVRSGKNDFADVEHILLDPTHLEIARGLDSYEQTIKDVERSLLKIIEFVRKPILLVSTFNTDYNGNPVPQRTVLEKAMNQVARDVRCAFFDPTQTVLRAGITNAILDLGHYKPDFEKEIADQMLKVIEKSLLECK